ncbi:AA1-like domain-containing protein (Fragment) [Madurella fahalii]|uniref:AA1-like domain-containing protein n=1 Tax=Madurella fahalii TaxID=1157608 RepID=A0ABQ0G7E5_9PEZI
MRSALILLAATFTALASPNPVNSRTEGHGHGHGSSCNGKPPKDGKCWKDILGLEWTVHGFDYHALYTFTNPAHQNSWGYVNFNLTNNVVPYTAVCGASSSQLTDFFYGNLDYNCVLPATAPAGSAVKFRFSRPAGQLDIEETIICSEKKTSGTFVATGSTSFTLSCTDITNVTENWQPGMIYSSREVKCAPIDITFSPSQVVG